MAAGGGIFVSGLFLPVYTNADLAGRIKADACEPNGYRLGWNNQLYDLLTWHHALVQGGLSLMLVGAVLFFLRKQFPDNAGRWPQSPGRLRTFFTLGMFSCAVSWAGFCVGIILDVTRGDDVPWCADSAGIPIMSGTIAYAVMTAIAAMVGALVIMGFGQLPTPLARWDSGRPIRSWVVSMIAGLIIAPLSLMVLLSATESFFLSVPGHVIMIYLVASARSAWLAPGNQLGLARK